MIPRTPMAPATESPIMVEPLTPLLPPPPPPVALAEADELVEVPERIAVSDTVIVTTLP